VRTAESNPAAYNRGVSDDTIELLQGWYAGDRKALEKLVADNLEWMRAYVRQRMTPQMRQRFDSIDFVQDGALQLVKNAPKYAPANRAQFRAFVAEVLLNVVRGHHDALTAQKRNAAREEALPSQGVSRLEFGDRSPTMPPEAAERAEVRTWVQLALEMLDPTDRELVRLRQHEELEFDVIAARLSLGSADAARMRFNRALPKLAVTVKQLQSAVKIA
jgi:RNA polymerase sigma factor (sigma-70 family)